MTKIVFINGPRGSGKDTAAAFLVQAFGCRMYKMAGPMKAAIPELLNISHDDAKVYFEDQACKIRPHSAFFGMTPVQFLIMMSEVWIKPRFGNDFFGKVAVRSLTTPTQAPFTAISDSGFRDECIPLVETFGPNNCLLLQLSRPDKTFEGDSRSYIELSDLGVTTQLIHNNFGLDVFKMQVVELTRKWLESVQ